MRLRTVVPLSLVAGLTMTGSLLVLPAAQAEPVEPQLRDLKADNWCATGVERPCVERLTRGSQVVPPEDGGWAPYVNLGREAGGTTVPFGVRRVTSAAREVDLGAGEAERRWSISIDTGRTVPRVVGVHGRDVKVVRGKHAGGHRVTISGLPVRLADSKECALGSWPAVCPRRATDHVTAYFGGVIQDYGAWPDPAQRDALYGVDYATNFAGTTPPLIAPDSRSGKDLLLARLVNQSQLADGTPFRGFAHLRVPGTALRHVYGIDRPAKLRPKGLVPRVDSGSVRVRRDGGAMVVDVTGMSARPQTLEVTRGNVVPLKPKRVRTKRQGPKRAQVRYRKAVVRGVKVDRYVVRCKAFGKKHSVKVVDHRLGPRTQVKGLRPGTKYRCWVRAVSDAGSTGWSKSRVLKARP